jgi:hypothetical protein
MNGAAFDPFHFFDTFTRFVDTSETGPWLQRLNARYVALVHSNRESIAGCSVLDVASHDGRFSFAALQNGASRVVGIEHKAHLVVTSRENMEFYEIPRDRYEFVAGDMFDHIDRFDHFDVVFCFGILYHITDHMMLLSRIAALEPQYVVIDTNISQHEGAVIELRNARGVSPPPPGSYIEGYPTRQALEAMLSYFGWTYDYFDWQTSGLTDTEHMGDYRLGRRITARAACNISECAPDVRARAVRMVLEHPRDPRTQWIAMTEVAARLGITPQLLRTWVHKAQRESGSTRVSDERPT